MKRLLKPTLTPAMKGVGIYLIAFPSKLIDATAPSFNMGETQLLYIYIYFFFFSPVVAVLIFAVTYLASTQTAPIYQQGGFAMKSNLQLETRWSGTDMHYIDCGEV